MIALGCPRQIICVPNWPYFVSRKLKSSSYPHWKIVWQVRIKFFDTEEKMPTIDEEYFTFDAAKHF